MTGVLLCPIEHGCAVTKKWLPMKKHIETNIRVEEDFNHTPVDSNPYFDFN